MQRFKRSFFQFTAWHHVSTRWTSQVIRSIRESGYFVPVTWSTFWAVRETDRPRQPVSLGRRERARVVPTTRASTGERIRKALTGFVLWFGLLFSAALIGTFIVLGIVLAYAFLMSLIGY